MTLTEFLLARIAEDEGFALAARPYTPGDAPMPFESALHIARHSPARVLAECESKRSLITDLNAERHEVVDGDCWYTCSAATEERDGGETCDDSRLHGECDCGRDGRVKRRLRILALPYMDHSDYPSEWKP